MSWFSSAGSSLAFPQSGSYRDAASINQNLYNNIQAAHAQRIAQANAAQQSLQAGYSGLSNAVLRRLRGSNRANIQDISDKYTAMSGKVQADLIARGLGNTSILGDLTRGVASDRAREVTRSRGDFAQLMAGMQSRIGLAGLDARMQGIGLMSGLQGDQISSMERVNAPYPAGGGGFGFGGGGGMPGMPGASATPGPIGGVQPAWTRTGGGAGFYGMPSGGSGYTDQNGTYLGLQPPPNAQMYGSQPAAAMSGGGGGMWGPMYAGLQTMGQVYNQEYAPIPPMTGVGGMGGDYDYSQMQGGGGDF